MRNVALSDPSQALPVRILAVIVLYKVAPLECESFRTLVEAIKHIHPDDHAPQIFFYDNTPGGQQVGSLPQGVWYEADPLNRGLPAAYNRALALCSEQAFNWMLTLDQDTSLPADFLVKLYSALRYVNPMSNLAAVAPLVSDRGKVISPNALGLKLFPKFFPQDFVGVSLGRTSAINSAATLRVEALREIGGYDPLFRLDYSDAVTFHRLHCNGKRIFVAGNIKVHHELSVLDIKHRVTLERYRNILAAESAFWDECMGWISNLALPLRYFYRIFYKFWWTKATLPYFRLNLRYLILRIFLTKRQRQRLWQQSSSAGLD
jgi:GT2 family glycosyltransferase